MNTELPIIRGGLCSPNDPVVMRLRAQRREQKMKMMFCKEPAWTLLLPATGGARNLHDDGKDIFYHYVKRCDLPVWHPKYVFVSKLKCDFYAMRRATQQIRLAGLDKPEFATEPRVCPREQSWLLGLQFQPNWMLGSYTGKLVLETLSKSLKNPLVTQDMILQLIEDQPEKFQSQTVSFFTKIGDEIKIIAVNLRLGTAELRDLSDSVGDCIFALCL